MEFLAQIGYFGTLSPDACSLYGLILLLMSVWLALNLKQPEKED